MWLRLARWQYLLARAPRGRENLTQLVGIQAVKFSSDALPQTGEHVEAGLLRLARWQYLLARASRARPLEGPVEALPDLSESCSFKTSGAGIRACDVRTTMVQSARTFQIVRSTSGLGPLFNRVFNRNCA